MKNIKGKAIFLVAYLTILNLVGQTYVSDDGYAKFNASVSFNNYDGESNELAGAINFDNQKVSFNLPAKSIKTGIDKRDEHMYELIEVENHKYVSFKGKMLDDFDFNSDKPQSIRVKGDFTLAGYTREVTITGTLQHVENGIQLTADWDLFITNYDLERPSLTVVKVDDEHMLEIEALLQEKKELAAE